jgi:hypothetical protein
LHARLANDLARLATVDVDVRRISNPPFKIKNLWVMTRVSPWATFARHSVASKANGLVAEARHLVAADW